jgi:hypothetical protein
MKKLLLIITAMVAIQVSAIAQTNFDFSAVCASGQTLYYQITDADAHEVALVPPTSGGWGSYPRPHGDIIFPETVEHEGSSYDVVAIGDSTFYNCRGITGSIVLPDNIRTIGSVAFYGCSGVTGSLTLPQNLESMGYGAFWWLEYLTGPITIPQGVTRIEERTFAANRRITSYDIPASVTYIGYQGLCCGSRLESIHVDEANPNYYSENNALIERDSKILILGTKNTIIPDDVVKIGCLAFYMAGVGQESQPLVIPNSVKILDDYSLHCANFNPLTLPDSLTYIGDNALFQNTLAQSEIPPTVTHIGEWAFAYCGTLDGGLVIPEGIDTIGDNTFYRCQLTSVSMPTSVVSIGEEAFCGCRDLQSITCNGVVPPELGATTFQYTSKDIPVYIPYGSHEAYTNAPFWSEFTNFIEMTDGPALNTEWYYEIQNENGSITYQHLECAADTTINHKEVTIIIRTNTLYDKGEHSEVTREYVYEENGVLYWWNKDLQEFTTLYNYNAEEGSEWEVTVGLDSITMHVDAVDEYEYEGKTVKMLHVSDDNNVFSGIIFCGVGHMTSYFPERLMQKRQDYRVVGIRCFWRNGELVFKYGERDCNEVYEGYHNGIEEDGPSMNSGSFTIYPNPTNGVLFVEMRHGTSLPTQTYRITNLMGQTVQTGSLNAETQQIDVLALPQGMYFISVGDMTQKFVVK